MKSDIRPRFSIYALALLLILVSSCRGKEEAIDHNHDDVDEVPNHGDVDDDPLANECINFSLSTNEKYLNLQSILAEYFNNAHDLAVGMMIVAGDVQEKCLGN